MSIYTLRIFIYVKNFFKNYKGILARNSKHSLSVVPYVVRISFTIHPFGKIVFIEISVFHFILVH